MNININHFFLFTCQNKRSHSGDEPGEEGIEGKRAHQAAVHELNYAREHNAE